MKLNLNYKQMLSLPYSQRRDLPAKPGIYYVGNCICPVSYIGLTKNLRNRHFKHHRQLQFQSMEDAVIRYKSLPNEVIQRITEEKLSGILRRLEKQAIVYYNPPLNCTPVPPEINSTDRRTVSSVICGTGLWIRYE